MTKRVLIAGSGVAAVEAVLALRHVAAPFGLGGGRGRRRLGPLRR
jgi:hypothetical protein